MPLPAKAFQRWLNGVAPDTSTADICRVSGVKRTTLAQQLVRGKVAETTVVSISRAYNINPVAALATFDTYSDLASSSLPPSDKELVSQIATVDLLRAVIVRTAPKGSTGTGCTGTGTGQPELSPPPHATSVKNWVDAIDDGELRHRVSAATGVAPQNYSAQLTANRLAPELALATSRAAGVGLAGGLVATGLVTEAEAGWPPGARQAALDRLSDGDLAALSGERLQALGKTLRRQEQDQEQTERIWENLV
ncbi:hypothetical protein [Arthrobacter sp. ISL-65]|uniref:hypothetical protein n=1 Tax=Arthrobacter sp. ISL-65 TaxID=2819112 RepID=UPI001BE69433|nr:hypothetical protein [Arthrobacter sp. ISL-65]MBT2547581.1 hypothetical protein [Arthrobacter sp. ISL-65]